MKKVVLLMSVVFFVPLTKLFALTVEEENQKIRNFLELTDESGIKNGDKVCDWGYSPDDIKTWGRIERNQEGYVTDIDWYIAIVDKIKVDNNLNNTKKPNFGDILIGDLDLSFFEYLEELMCPYNDLKSINLENCTSLKSFYCENNYYLKSVNLKGCSSLIFLNVFYNNLKSISLEGCHNLIILNISNNHLDLLDLTNCTQLQILTCASSNLDSLDLSKCVNLEELDCSFNNLSTLDISECKKLNKLICMANRLEVINLDSTKQLVNIDLSSNKLNIMNLDNFPKLETLSCRNNKLQSLILNSCTNISFIDCYGCGLIEIDLSNLKFLKELNCGNNRLSELNLNNNIKLLSLLCDKNQLTTLDLTQCKNLYTLVCHSNLLSEIKAYLYKNYMRLSVNDVEMGYVAHISSGGGWHNPFRRHIRAVEKEGYVFCGWYSNNVLFSLKKEVEVNNDGFSGDLVAVFRSVDDVDKINIEDVIITTLNGNVFIKSGQEFLGGMISIYDLSGMKIKSLQMNDEEFYLSINKQGVYIVCLEHEDKRISKKVVVN